MNLNQYLVDGIVIRIHMYLYETKFWSFRPFRPFKLFGSYFIEIMGGLLAKDR